LLDWSGKNSIQAKLSYQVFGQKNKKKNKKKQKKNKKNKKQNKKNKKKKQKKQKTHDMKVLLQPYVQVFSAFSAKVVL